MIQNKKLSARRWAADITLILNAIPNFERFPVNVKAVAKEISRLKFPNDPITLIKGEDIPDFEGAMRQAPAGKKGWGIFYNNTISSKGRINFTLAHEFGHYLLHRHDHPKGLECSAEDMARWDSKYNQLENQANDFAASLLMPLDDYRKQIDAKIFPNFDLLGVCADRYQVSLLASTLRWLSFTSRRAVLVTSRDGFILWSRSSEPALKSGLYFKVKNRPPIEIPNKALANSRKKLLDIKTFANHDKDVWFDQPCREHVLFSDQYDFTMSLLQFEDKIPRYEFQKPMNEDTFDRFQRSNTKRNRFS